MIRRVPTAEEIIAWRAHIKFRRDAAFAFEPTTAQREAIKTPDYDGAITVDQGHQAAGRGARRDSCPYDDGTNDYFAWHCGYTVHSGPPTTEETGVIDNPPQLLGFGSEDGNKRIASEDPHASERSAPRSLGVTRETSGATSDCGEDRKDERD